MKKMKLLFSKKGFTLIELMIVVGIIGILVSIAAPNFAKYQSKSRQSEAKIALAAIYTAEKGFYSEYNAYVNSMDAIGYAPEGNKRFYSVGWSTSAGTTTGYSGGVANQSFARTNYPSAYADCTVTLSAVPGNAATDTQVFTVQAGGQLRDGLSTCDHWSMDQDKVVLNVTQSL